MKIEDLQREHQDRVDRLYAACYAARMIWLWDQGHVGPANYDQMAVEALEWATKAINAEPSIKWLRREMEALRRMEERGT